METIRVTYKTVQGYVKDLDNYTDFEKLLDGYSQTVKIGGKYAYKRHFPSDECLKQIGELLATMWPARRKNEIVAKVMRREADNSFLQSFILDARKKPYHVSSGLSGPNEEYCKREWLKSLK